MSRKHYIALAKDFAEFASDNPAIPRAALAYLLGKLCATLKAGNPEFSAAKFRAACGF